jgi:hypothetical protein
MTAPTKVARVFPEMNPDLALVLRPRSHSGKPEYAFM